MYSVKRICYQLIVPVVLILVSLMIVWKWPQIQAQFKNSKELKAFLVLLPVLPYVIFSIGVLMGWRYNNMGLVMGSVVLVLSYLITLRFSPGQWSNTYYEAYIFLLPLNMVMCSLLIRRYIFTPKSFLSLFLLLFQTLVITILCGRIDFSSSAVVSKFDSLIPFASIRLDDFSNGFKAFLKMEHLVIFKQIPTPAIISFLLSLTYLSVRFLKNRDILLAGYIGSLAAVFLSAAANRPEPASVVFHITAGLILIITNIEASFFMAYNDELTGLPDRRSLNESMVNLGKKYAIAMMDIDHFKKFNDTYGHKTGDDVLKVVATRLKEISGQAKVFRYGGEEFTAVFQGKSVKESIPHLENFRKTLETSQFVIRRRTRKQNTPVKRGPGPAARQKQVRITISIGVSEPGKHHPTPEKVIKAADKALYKAKKTGRNRVCC
ncbi:MAG: GGDEF domain-containing protein [Desulfobacteraceae bacterium]|nr:GGDEF domain-containing protein [Desulfobacteraceae bacterium]MBC2757330.1 GGDEF domain-containing protein [Desulfobacteraceae bacterium]